MLDALDVGDILDCGDCCIGMDRCYNEGTCAYGAIEPELFDVHVLSVDRIDRIVLTFLLSEARYNFEHFV